MTDTIPHVPARLRGLDTLRAAALVLVLMSHYTSFVSRQATFGWIGEVGWAGVDLFFVLSGYLIGSQILSPLARGEPFSLGDFFARRLLRTLPNYYVVLALYWLAPPLLAAVISGSGAAPLWRYLTFTQNIGLQYGQTFTHSWSLCIEEQFYLLLPLAALAVHRVATRAGAKAALRLGWTLIAAGIAVGVAARGAGWQLHGWNAFSAETYYSTTGRFDELLPGVAIAMLRHFHADLFARLLRHGNALLAAGLALVLAMLACLNGAALHTLAVSACGFSLLAIGFALMTLSALSPVSLLYRLRVPGAASLALWSYAAYLMHKPVFMLASAALARLHVEAGQWWLVAPVWAAGLVAGWLLFIAIETPFMRLRARWFPSRPGRAAVSPGAASPSTLAATVPPT